MNLIQSGHHVAAKICGIRDGDPLILRDWWTHEPCYVVYAIRDQVDDTRIPTAMKRTGHGNMVLFWVYPKSGKVADMAMYAVRATEAEAARAAMEIEANRIAKGAKA